MHTASLILAIISSIFGTVLFIAWLVTLDGTTVGDGAEHVRHEVMRITICFGVVFVAMLLLTVFMPSLEQLKDASEPNASGHGAAKP